MDCVGYQMANAISCINCNRKASQRYYRYNCFITEFAAKMSIFVYILLWDMLRSTIDDGFQSHVQNQTILLVILRYRSIKPYLLSAFIFIRFTSIFQYLLLSIRINKDKDDFIVILCIYLHVFIHTNNKHSYGIQYMG